MPGWNAQYDAREFRERHFGEITHLDAAFGRVMDFLDQSGLAENTIVFFTSDHGEMAAAHGMFGKSVMHDESVRVPMLVRRPGIEPAVVDEPLGTVDVMPTLLELADAAPPPAAEGRSFADLLTGGRAPEPARTVMVDYKTLCAVNAQWKLECDRDGPPPAPFPPHNRPLRTGQRAGRPGLRCAES